MNVNDFMVKKDKSVLEFKIDGKPFYETEINTPQACNLEKYKEVIEAFTLSERIDFIIKSLGFNPKKLSLYNKLLKLTQLIPYVMPKYNLLLLGDKCTCKSSFFNCYSNLAEVIPGFPSVAELRGSKTNNENKALLENLILVFEEISDNSVDNSLSLLKNTLQSGTYKDKSRNEKKILTSCVFIGNNYLKIRDIRLLGDKTIIFKNLHKSFEDDALFDRFNAVIYMDEKFKINDSIFLDKNDTGLNINILMAAFSELHSIKYTLEFNNSLQNSRDSSRVYATVKGLCKILYPDNNIPSGIKEGLTNFAFHLRTIGKEFNNPFPASSIPFLIDAIGETDIDEVSLLRNRLLIKKRGNNYFKKIALNEWGIEENNLELDYFKKTSCNINSEIANIDIKHSTNLIIVQEYFPLYSNKHTFSSNGVLIKKEKEDFKKNAEFNLLLITNIKISVLTNNQITFPKYELRNWKEMTDKELEKKVKKIFHITNKEINLKKSNYSYDYKSTFRLINFSDYLLE